MTRMWVFFLLSLLCNSYVGSAFSSEIVLEDPEDYDRVTIDFDKIISISFEVDWHETVVDPELNLESWKDQPLKLKDETGELRNYLLYCDLQTELTKVRDNYLNDKNSGYPWLVFEVLEKFQKAYDGRITFHGKGSSLPLTILSYDVRSRMKSPGGRIPTVIPHGRPIPIDVLFGALVNTWFTKNLNGRIVINIGTS